MNDNKVTMNEFEWEEFWALTLTDVLDYSPPYEPESPGLHHNEPTDWFPGGQIHSRQYLPTNNGQFALAQPGSTYQPMGNDQFSWPCPMGQPGANGQSLANDQFAWSYPLTQPGSTYQPMGNDQFSWPCPMGQPGANGQTLANDQFAWSYPVTQPGDNCETMANDPSGWSYPVAQPGDNCQTMANGPFALSYPVAHPGANCHYTMGSEISARPFPVGHPTGPVSQQQRTKKLRNSKPLKGGHTCVRCGTTTSPVWRGPPQPRLCNACYCYQKKYNKQRPQHLAS